MGPDPDYNDPTPGMHIWGWMSPAELTWLGARAAEMRSVVEVGVLHGRSAFALLTACPGRVYCIDPWDDVGDHCYPSFMSACGHFENLVPIRGYSPAAASRVPFPVDMVFLDGDHAYESVIADIDVWLPRTVRLICGHDYSGHPEAGYPGVKRAVDERFGDAVHVADDTGIWAVDLR